MLVSVVPGVARPRSTTFSWNQIRHALHGLTVSLWLLFILSMGTPTHTEATAESIRARTRAKTSITIQTSAREKQAEMLTTVTSMTERLAAMAPTPCTQYNDLHAQGDVTCEGNKSVSNLWEIWLLQRLFARLHQAVLQQTGRELQTILFSAR